MPYFVSRQLGHRRTASPACANHSSSPGNRGEDSDDIPGFELRLLLLEETDVLRIEENVDETSKLLFIRENLGAKQRVFIGSEPKSLSYVRGLDFDRIDLIRETSQSRRDQYGDDWTRVLIGAIRPVIDAIYHKRLNSLIRTSYATKIFIARPI
jgi:hypothetical protein